MESQYEIKTKLNMLQNMLTGIAASERASSPDGIAIAGELSKQISELRDKLPTSTPLLPQPGDNYLNTSNVSNTYNVVPVNSVGKKDFRSLFGKIEPNNNANFKSLRDYISVINSGRYDPRLDALKRGITEGSPSGGGWLVPTEYAAAIHDVALESEIILPRAQVVPMASNTKIIPAATIGDHSQNLFGGVSAYFEGEGGTLQERDPKFRSQQITAYKMTELFAYSSEWIEDAVNGEAWLRNAMGQALGWFRDYYFINGNGAGQPLGLLHSPCLKTIAAETAQDPDTILYENCVKMMAAMAPSSFNNAIWLAHQTTLPQLMQLSVLIGTAGVAIPALTSQNGQYYLFNKPLILTEKVPTLGEAGDLIFVDLSQYAVGLRSELRYETSIHIKFQTDEVMGRLISRFDGQSLWNEPLTLADGVTTVSPIVVIAAR